MPYKVKIFTSDKLKELEQEVNDFLLTLEQTGAEAIGMKPSESYTSDADNNFWSYSILVSWFAGEA